MDQREMRFVKNMVEIVVVIVYLRWRELSLIHDILRRKRAHIESFGQSTFELQVRII